MKTRKLQRDSDTGKETGQNADVLIIFHTDKQVRKMIIKPISQNGNSLVSKTVLFFCYSTSTFKPKAEDFFSFR